jgi:hypothetical protein
MSKLFSMSKLFLKSICKKKLSPNFLLSKFVEISSGGSGTEKNEQGSASSFYYQKTNRGSPTLCNLKHVKVQFATVQQKV